MLKRIINKIKYHLIKEIVLVDSENIGYQIPEEIPKHTLVYLFISDPFIDEKIKDYKNNKHIKLINISNIRKECITKNIMDFCIVAELTNLLSYVSKKTRIVICSKDRGYDASILYLKEKYPKQLVSRHPGSFCYYYNEGNEDYLSIMSKINDSLRKKVLSYSCMDSLKNALSKNEKKLFVVEEYINTAEPVSSNALTDNHGLDCSSATIRNEMADLEKKGYLDKTHTSSGRVPSAKGYRYYVDELLNDKDISLEEIKYISSKLETKVNEIEDLTKITANTISEVTHYTTVSIGPKPVNQLIEEIKFVLLGSRMMMAVILTDTGLVKETIIKFDEDINEKQVETMNYMFNNKLKGQPIETIDRPLEEYLYDEMTYSVNVIKPVIEQIKKVLEEDNKIYLEGANKSFDLPEFNSLEVAKNFINILDKKEMVADMLDSGFAEDIKVYIGEENEKEQLKDFSVVTFKHKVNGKDLGTIGIIGPKRMDYSKVISVMKYINQKLNGKSN